MKIVCCISYPGYYLYLEATGQQQGDKAELVSPDYKGATQGICFEFWYHMYGVDVGSLNIFQSYGGQRYQLATLSGNHGNLWKKKQVTIRNNNQHKVRDISGYFASA